MSLVSNLTDAFTRVATEFKSIRTLIGGSATADISGLNTTDKTSLVGAINEVDGNTPPDASTTVKGIVELATSAETATGTDAVRAVTPAGLASLGLGTPPPDASLTVKGIVELATTTETTTGTDAVRAVTPAGVAAAIAGKANTSSLSTVATSGSAADLTGTLGTAQLPPLAINETFVAANQAAMLALTAQRGDMAIRSDNGKTYVLSSDSPGTLADWKEILAAGQVQSVAGKTGVVTLVKGDVGLGNVDNTSDANKPVSSATQTALNLKADASAVYSTTQIGDPTTDFAAGFVAALT